MAHVADDLSEPVFAWWTSPPEPVLVAVFPDEIALGYECNRKSWGRCVPEPTEIRYATLEEATELYRQEKAFGESMERDRLAGYKLD